MSEEGRIFLEDCGATGPLQLEWSDWNSEEMIRRVFDQPSVMVGRNADADLCLDHARVSKRHAYVQMIEGRLYAIDLDSRDGLRWSDVPRPAGWIDPRRPMQLGPTTIGVVESGVVEGEAPGAGPGPLSRRFASRHTLPGAVLEIRGDGVEPTRWPMDRVLTLVGCAPACKVRLLESGTSRYACALVRTPKGVWVVDLLSSRGVTVNGVARRRARLEDGDSIQIGGQSIRLTYDGLRSSTPSNLPSRPGRIPTDLNREAWELVPDLVLGQLQGRGNPASETGGGPLRSCVDDARSTARRDPPGSYRDRPRGDGADPPAQPGNGLFAVSIATISIKIPPCPDRWYHQRDHHESRRFGRTSISRGHLHPRSPSPRGRAIDGERTPRRLGERAAESLAEGDGLAGQALRKRSRGKRC